MKLKMMAIYDTASKAFLPPFFVASEAVALRELAKLGATQLEHDFVKYSDQYNLYSFGDFDNESGEFFDLGQNSLGSLKVIFNRVKVVQETN